MMKILGSLLLFSLTFVNAGSFNATVDRNELVKGETVLLTLTVTGQETDTIPEIEEIDHQKVVNIQRHPPTFEVVVANGKNVMEKTDTLVLELKPDSNMTIPPFFVTVDGKLEKTKAIKIKVLTEARAKKQASENFSLRLVLNKKRAYVGESLVLSVYFKQRNNIKVTQIDYVPPKLEEFFSKQLGEGSRMQEGIYTIQELDYLLIPKRAGIVGIESARARVLQRSLEKQPNGDYHSVAKWSEISSPSLTLDVLSIEEPHDIVGEYNLSSTIDKTKVEANQPVRLNVELVGRGSLDEYEGIDIEIPNVTIYKDEAVVKSRLIGKNLESHYVKSFVFIAEKSFTIPSVSLRAFNPETGKVDILKTKSYFVEVSQSGVVQSLTNSVQTKEPVSIEREDEVNSQLQNERQGSIFPTLIALFLAFILGILVTFAYKYLAEFFRLNERRKSVLDDKYLKVLYPKMSESLEVEEMVRKLYAYKNGDKSVQIDKKRLRELVEEYKERS